MTIHPTRRALLGAGAALAMPAVGASAQGGAAQGGAGGAERNLTVGIGGSVTSLDPHFFNASPNNSLAMHVFDMLVQRDAAARVSPGLAESWRAVEPTVWEFKLRRGVKWHDGRDFTADDVAFTVERAPNVPNSPGGFGGFLRAITRAEVVDPLTIRFHTAAPHPLLPTELASVAIIARHAAGNATTADFNSGRAAIGTGPYKIAAYRPGDRTELVRNDDYWGGAEPWSRVSYRFMANDSSRAAALLAGDVDLIDQVPTSDLARMRGDNRVSIAEIGGLRLIYLFPDFSREGPSPYVTDNAGTPLPRNPFRDLKVRQALSLAINREALCRQIMQGTAQPTGQWLPPGSYSYNPEVTPPPFQADRARALLAEAGFPQGFRVTLHGPNDRYPNDAQTIQAIAQMWTRVGVQTQVDAQPWAAFSPRNARQEYAIRLVGWGSVTGEASYLLVNILNTFDAAKRTGASNNGRYSNPALDTLTERATAILDDGEREKALQQAVKVAMDDLGIIPLFQLTNVWASKRGITYEPRADERTVAMGTRPAVMR
ncbi:ABC transporter substrate-binding protein [Roseomonas sp. CCTCC AB2023176]|uniref:ABC transporter substrate-binding protein n=1 Tax=Roseomonas sp. CCTCC AB2023176 TaxID=3342640 RepID=UPI0035DCACFA